jgi:hypothetical protein
MIIPKEDVWSAASQKGIFQRREQTEKTTCFQANQYRIKIILSKGLNLEPKGQIRMRNSKEQSFKQTWTQYRDPIYQSKR